MYTKIDKQGNTSIVFLYVDDMIYIGNIKLANLKNAMKKEFEMTNLDLMKYFLGIEVEQFEKEISIFQNK